MLIAFEGLNGTGKSTLARSVAARLGAEFLEMPPKEATDARRLFDDDPFGEAAMLFYLSFAARYSDLVARRPAQLFVVDRFLASTLAYGSASGRDPEPFAARLTIRSPDLTVLVTTTETVRRQRLARRPSLRLIDEATFDPVFRQRVLDFYQEKCQPLIRVDQTDVLEDVSARDTATRIQRALPAPTGREGSVRV